VKFCLYWKFLLALNLNILIKKNIIKNFQSHKLFINFSQSLLTADRRLHPQQQQSASSATPVSVINTPQFQLFTGMGMEIIGQFLKLLLINLIIIFYFF
jgi:uncharacterized membrane protein